MEDFFDRLDKYMEYRGLNDNKVTVQAGIPVGSLGKQRKGSRGLSVQSIAKILCAYPELDATWLISGNGQMLIKDDNPNVRSEEEPPDKKPEHYRSLVKSQQDFISSQQQSINNLLSELARANDTIKAKQDIIDDFREQIKIKDAELLFIKRTTKENPSSSAAGGSEGRQAG